MIFHLCGRVEKGRGRGGGGGGRDGELRNGERALSCVLFFFLGFALPYSRAVACSSGRARRDGRETLQSAPQRQKVAGLRKKCGSERVRAAERDLFAVKQRQWFFLRSSTFSSLYRPIPKQETDCKRPQASRRGTLDIPRLKSSEIETRKCSIPPSPSFLCHRRRPPLSQQSRPCCSLNFVPYLHQQAQGLADASGRAEDGDLARRGRSRSRSGSSNGGGGREAPGGELGKLREQRHFLVFPFFWFRRRGVVTAEGKKVENGRNLGR